MEEPVITQTEPETSGTTAESQSESSVNISDYIESDGKFKEGWKDKFVPEELRTNKFYDIFPDIQGVLKAAGHQAVTLGKYGTTKGVLPITDKSSDIEIQAYKEAMGVPKDSSGYKYTNPEGITDKEFPAEMKKAVFDTFNKENYTQKQVDAAMGLWDGRMKELQQQYETKLKTLVADSENDIRGKWDDKYDSRLNLAKSFISKVTNEMSPTEYDSLFGKEVKNQDGSVSREGGINSPEYSPIKVRLLDLFANIEERYGLQDSALISDSSASGKSVQSQLDELEKTPGFVTGELRQKDRKLHDELIERRSQLYKKLYPEAKK